MLRRGAIGLLLLGLLLCGGVTAQPGERASWKPIKVGWYGQSFFIVESSKGYRVAFDPHLIEAFGRPMGLKANLVLMSHNHNDHTMVEALDNHKDKSLRRHPRPEGAGAARRLEPGR